MTITHGTNEEQAATLATAGDFELLCWALQQPVPYDLIMSVIKRNPQGQWRPGQAVMLVAAALNEKGYEGVQALLGTHGGVLCSAKRYLLGRTSIDGVNKLLRAIDPEPDCDQP